MRLISCHIENFGNLHDFTYFFDDDLSVIFAGNGWGKSTFAAFLKVMFYGFDGESRRNKEGNERLRYKPWGGGIYGGSVTWSGSGKTYRMLRTFGAGRKDDTFALFDEETGLSSGDFTAQTGEELFGIDSDSFRRTVFWSQSDHETFATTSIQAKIGDLSARPDDLPAYDDAVKRLRKEADRLRPDRAGGLLRKKEEKLGILMAEEAGLPALGAQYSACAAREEGLNDALHSIRARRRQYLLSCAQTPVSPSSSSASGMSSGLRREKIAGAEKKRAALVEEEHSIRRSGQKERREYILVKKALQHALLEKKRRQKWLRTGAAVAFALALITAALCFTDSLPVYCLLLSALAAAGGLAIFGQVGLRKDRIPETEEILNLRREEAWHAEQLRSLRGKLYRNERQLRECIALLASLRAKAEEEITEGNKNASDAGSLQIARTGSAAAPKLSAETAQALADLDRQEEKCRADLLEVRQQAEGLKERIRECEASAALIPGLQAEIKLLREQYDTCVRTLSYLEEARNLFASRYISPFLRSFSRYYSMLSGESADAVRTDADFSISLMDSGLPRDPALMSEGTRDLISLCRRMAMIDAMYPGEKPFLVLDDPFANLDDERVKGGLRFLHSASLEYQILYLTCHKSRF